MSGDVGYAVVGGPPDFWHDLKIVDLDTGESVRHVLEVNAIEGWLIRLKKNDKDQFYADGDEAAKERIAGRFRIERQ